MRPTARLRPIAVAAALVVVATACGSSDDAATTTSTAPPATAAPAEVVTPIETEATYEVEATPGVVYGTGETADGPVELVGDLYQPIGTDGPRPVAVLIHGGGFRSGYRGDKTGRIAEHMAQRGFVALDIDYRLEGDRPVPSPRVQPWLESLGGDDADPFRVNMVAAADDALTATDWLTDNADTYDLDLDLDRLVLGGGSAGAITAANIGFAADDAGVAAPDVAAVADFWGGIFVGEAADVVDEDDPAVFIVHGDADPQVPFLFSEQLSAAAEAAGVPVLFLPQAGGTHGFSNIDVSAVDPATGLSLVDQMMAFLQETLG